MCGIIGILSQENVTPRLIEGLSRLEYRGYDSAGIATLNDGAIDRSRAKGKLANLKDKLAANPIQGNAGIGHTRWATHGGPTEDNAHPHATEKVAVVHNGIIENYATLKSELKKNKSASKQTPTPKSSRISSTITSNKETPPKTPLTRPLHV